METEQYLELMDEAASTDEVKALVQTIIDTNSLDSLEEFRQLCGAWATEMTFRDFLELWYVWLRNPWSEQ